MDGCILLRPTDDIDGHRSLRRAVLGDAAREQGAHVTLLRPRHAAGVACDPAEIGRALGRLTVSFDAASCIEQQAGGVWCERGRFGCAR